MPVDTDASPENPDPITNFMTYYNVEEEAEGEAHFKGLSTILNMFPINFNVV